MQFLGDEKSIQQYLLELMEEISPQQPFSTTKNTVLLTSFNRSDISSLFSLLDSSERRRNNLLCKQTSNAIPNICFSSKELNTCLINAKKYLFVNPNNQCPNLSTLNLLYLLSYSSCLRILFVFSKEDFQDQSKIQSNIVQFLQILSITLGNSEQAQIFSMCIGLVIFDGNYKPDQEQFWVGQFQKILKNQKLLKNVPQLGKKTLKSIVQQKKVFVIGSNKTMQQLIQSVNKNIDSYKICPKVLTKLYTNILHPKQLQKIVKQISGEQMSYRNKIIQTVQLLKQAIDNKQIFNEDKIKRNQALQKQFFGQFPFSSIKQKAGKVFKREISYRFEQFAIQAALFQFIQLYKTQNQFVNNDLKHSYQTYNINNQSQTWEYDDMNMSILGSILNNFFSTHTIFYNYEMVATSKFLHTMVRIFECVPKVQIRVIQKQLIKNLQKIIEKFIQFFYQTMNSSVEYIIENKSQPIMPKKILSLTSDIKQLMKLLKQMSEKKRLPYSQMAQDIKDKKNYIVLTLFIINWKCYEVYKNFWSVEQKNKFMIEIQELVRNKDYREFLQNHEKDRTVRIVKKINQYFGDIYFKKKSYFIAIKFYTAAKLNWKLIEAWDVWLHRILKQDELNSQDIEQGIKKLASLGLVQDARKWCYRFMDKVDQNSFFISLLEHLVQLQRNQNIIVLEEIQKLKYDEISLVDDEIIREVINELQFEEWLKVQNYN